MIFVLWIVECCNPDHLILNLKNSNFRFNAAYPIEGAIAGDFSWTPPVKLGNMYKNKRLLEDLNPFPKACMRTATK